jgi:hypothetical protein
MADGEWRAQLPQDLKEHTAFQPYATLGDFAKAHLTGWDEQIKTYSEKAKADEGKIKELEGKVGEMIPRLPENATDEERSVYWHQLGKPETMEEYEIPVLEGQNPESTKWFREVSHKANLSKEQAKFIGQEWNNFLSEIIKVESEEMEKARSDAQASLVKELGGEEQYKTATALADRLWSTYTNQDFATFLKENGMIKNPLPILRVIIGLAKKTGEDLSPQHTPGGPQDAKGMMYDKSPAPPKLV